MKKLFFIAPIFAVLFTIFLTGCSNNTVFPPITTSPVLMGSIQADSVSLSVDGSATKTASLGSGPLNFTDRDSTIIAFYYKGNGDNTSVYKLQVIDSTAANGVSNIYTFSGPVSDVEQYVNITIPSHGLHAYYYYKISCTGTAPQSFAVRRLELYKK